MNELLEKALRIAVEAHAGQMDKAGKPYIFHPLRVCCQCFTDEEKIVAFLHDTIEDIEVTAEDLHSEGFPRNIQSPEMKMKAMRTSSSGQDSIRWVEL